MRFEFHRRRRTWPVLLESGSLGFGSVAPNPVIVAAIVADAHANGAGFNPGPGQLAAVIMDLPANLQPNGQTAQLNFIEVLCPQDHDCSVVGVKLVSSPDDTDGNPNDNHVTLPTDNAFHNLTYKVQVTAGPSALTNVTISDPQLVALGIPAPAPFSMAQ